MTTEPPDKPTPQPVERAPMSTPGISGEHPAVAVHAKYPPPPNAAPDLAQESDLWTGRTSAGHYAGRIILWGLANIAFGLLVRWIMLRWGWPETSAAVWAIAGVAAISGVWVLGKVLLLILGQRYRLTSQRLFLERGILSRTVDQLELIRVDDVRIHKTMIDRLFGLGSVAIVSTDATDRNIVLTGIAGADQVAEGIRDSTRVLRQRSLYVENV